MRCGFDFSPIYDAVSDDRAFSELARTIAKTSAANTAVLHWRFGDERPDHEASYTEDLINHEQPCATSAVGRVGEKIFDPKGDDAFIEWMQSFGQHYPHCVSGVFSSDDLTLAIGLHRGSEQLPFDAFALQQLEKMSRPIMDVIDFRSKLKTIDRERQIIEAAFDGLGTSIIMLTRDGHLCFANGAARRILERGDGLVLRGNRLYPANAEDSLPFFQSLSRVGTTQASRTVSILISRDGRSPYLLSLSTTGVDEDAYVMVVSQDPDHIDDSLVSRMRDLFGLGVAEAQIACALSDGHDIEAIAALRATSVGTVRNQLKSITAKMNCCRQSEVVAIIRSLPSLNIVSEMSSTILLEPGFATSRRTTSYDRNRSLRVSHGHQKSRTA